MSPAEAVQTYILARDGNRPFLMSRAFISRPWKASATSRPI